MICVNREMRESREKGWFRGSKNLLGVKLGVNHPFQGINKARKHCIFGLFLLVRSTGLEFAGHRIAVYCHVLTFPYLRGFSLLPVRLCIAVYCRIRGKFRGRIPLHIVHVFRLYNGSTAKENRHAGTGATALGDTIIIASVGQHGQAFSRISRFSRFTQYTQNEDFSLHSSMPSIHPLTAPFRPVQADSPSH